MLAAVVLTPWFAQRVQALPLRVVPAHFFWVCPCVQRATSVASDNDAMSVEASI